MKKALTSARRHWRLRSATALAAVGAVVLSSGVMMLAAPATADSNNGTLKVVNAASGLEFRDNEPKVCVFRFEGFGFDNGNTGRIVVMGQGQTTYGPVDVAGVEARQNGDIGGYFVTGNHELATGHYKVEFQEAGLSADKFKSKVFKVDCGRPPAERVPDVQTSSDCVNGHGTRTNYIVKEYVWVSGENGSGEWVLEPQSGWATIEGTWQYTPYNAEENARLCQTPTKDPLTVPVSEEQSSCEVGFKSRTGSQTTTFTWNPRSGLFDAHVGAPVWDPWTVRALNDAEFEALGCRPGQPDPKVVKLADERMGCEIGVEQRSGTQTTSYVWSAKDRKYDAVVGAEVWGDWAKIRGLTTEEFLDLQCVAGEETVIPKPDKPETNKPDSKPTVAGVQTVAPQASVPTAVEAGLAGDTGVTTTQLLGQGLAGMGLVMLLAAGWIVLSRRPSGGHVS